MKPFRLEMGASRLAEPGASILYPL